MTSYRLFEGYEDEEIELIISMYTDYLKEIFKDAFIGDYTTVRDMLQYKTGNLFIVHKNKKIVGFIEVTYNDMYNNIKPYLDIEQMYILPEYRSKMTIGNMFALICLISRANGNIPILGNTIVCSSNINNNIKAGGVKYSETFVFDPIGNPKSRRFYDRAIKIWEKNNTDKEE